VNPNIVGEPKTKMRGWLNNIGYCPFLVLAIISVSHIVKYTLKIQDRQWKFNPNKQISLVMADR